jgi:branched-chain amino acid transport system substrate-binding protein
MTVRRVRIRRRSSFIGCIVASLAVGILLTGCGSRLSHQELLKDARGGLNATEAIGAQSLKAHGAETTTTTTIASSSGNSGVSSGTNGQSAAGASASASTSAAGATAAHGAATAAASGTCTGTLSTINIGSVGAESGTLGAVFNITTQGVQAWVAWVNSTGGINCHPIKYIVEDDQSDPSTDLSEVQQEVSQDHVIAMLQMNAPLSGQASVSYLQQQGIPVIGNEGASPWFYTSPTYFPQSATGPETLVALVAGTGVFAKAHNEPNLATISCIESAVCSGLYSVAPTLASQNGMNLVYRSQASITEPTYTSNCQGAQQAGAQILIVGLDANSGLRLIQSCNSINYHPQYVFFGLAATPALVQSPSAAGGIIISSVLPPEDTSNAGAAQFDTVFKQYAAGVQATPAAMLGWVSAQLFAYAAKGLPNPTSQGLLSALYAMKGVTLGGLTNPLTFTQGQDAPQTYCLWDLQIQGGQYVSTDGFTSHCS